MTRFVTVDRKINVVLEESGFIWLNQNVYESYACLLCLD